MLSAKILIEALYDQEGEGIKACVRLVAYLVASARQTIPQIPLPLKIFKALAVYYVNM